MPARLAVPRDQLKVIILALFAGGLLTVISVVRSAGSTGGFLQSASLTWVLSVIPVVLPVVLPGRTVECRV